MDVSGKKPMRSFENVEAIAKSLLKKHKLGKWDFVFDKATRRAGATHYRDKKISMAKDFALKAPLKQVKNTILHEIAHVLVGPKHGEKWVKTAKKIGCSGDVRHNITFTKKEWKVTCTKKCFVSYISKKLKPAQKCKTCKSKVICKKTK